MECVQCGAGNPGSNRFCGDCGARLPRAADAPAAERRQLTVVFCDLVGSTALSTRLDPEDVRLVNRGYREVCAAIVARYGGVIASYMGDGIMVYFGYPRAHEDDAERAVRAGLAMARAVSGLEPLPGVSLRVRVGIDTGRVVVGDLIGDGTAETRAVSGESANVAARLQAQARPGGVVISERTHRLVDGLFDLEPLGRRSIKGVPDPLRCWRVESEREVESRFEALRPPRRAGELVGRRREMERMIASWERAREGEGQVLWVTGEAGIGKSRMLHALREHIGRDRRAIMRYQCSPYHTTSSLYPVVVQVQKAAGIAPEDAPHAKRAKLAALFGDADAPPDLPELLASLLGVPSGDGGPAPEPSPQQHKQRLFEALVDDVFRVAGERPLAIFFEDVHWIDPTTLELLETLVERMGGAHLLLVVTSRPGFSSAIETHARTTPVALAPLGREESAALVHAITGGRRLPPRVLERIVDRTDGVPLFVEEVTQAVLESGSLRREGEAYVLTGPLADPAIPSTLQDSLEARLERIGDAKEVAQVGAAIGRDFPYDLLAAVLDGPGGALDAALAKIEAAGLAFRRGQIPRATFRFRHSLIRDVAYDSLLRTRRRQIHARIAGTLERDFPARAESEPEVLAHHLTEACHFEQAIPYWQRAGRRAAELSANVEATEHFGRALELLERVPGEGRARDELALDLQIGLAGSLIATQGYSAPETERTYARALELSERIGETPQLFPVLYGRWIFHAMVGEVERAYALARDFLRLAARQRADGPGLVAQRVLGTSLVVRGEPLRARAHLEAVIARYDPARHHALCFLYGQDVRIAGACYQALGLWLLGHPDDALRLAHATLDRARSLSHANTLGYALLHLGGLLESLCGHPQAAREAAAALERVAVENQLPVYGAAWGAFAGHALAETGRVREGVDLMRASRERLLAAKLVYMLPVLTTFHARGCAKLRRFEEAFQLLDEAQALCERRGDRWFEAEIHRTRGDLLGAAGTGDGRAERSLRRALEVARGQGARSLELRAATGLARLLRVEKRGAEARETLAPILEWFGETSDLPDLRCARALLEELSEELA